MYRPSAHPLRPLRGGRAGFEINRDGSFVRHGIGPTDGPSAERGRWWVEGDHLAFQLDDGERGQLLILSCEPDVLTVKR